MNDLQVVARAEQAAVQARDEELARAVQTAFATPAFKDITVVVQNGVVRLTGTVPTGAQRLEAAVVARAIPGVRAVQDDLRLATAPTNRACAPRQQEAPDQAGGRDRRPTGAARTVPHRHAAERRTTPVVTARAVATGNARRTDGGKIDKIKGRIKEAVGALTDNDSLKREGQRDQVVGEVKEKWRGCGAGRHRGAGRGEGKGHSKAGRGKGEERLTGPRPRRPTQGGAWAAQSKGRRGRRAPSALQGHAGVCDLGSFSCPSALLHALPSEANMKGNCIPWTG